MALPRFGLFNVIVPDPGQGPPGLAASQKRSNFAWASCWASRRLWASAASYSQSRGPRLSLRACPAVGAVELEPRFAVQHRHAREALISGMPPDFI